MPYLVDGDNLLGTWRERSRTDAERRRLVFELRRFGGPERRVVVVFDGAAPPGVAPEPDVLYASPREADAVILELLERDRDRRGWTVVTSDRSLGDRCRWLGARVVRSDRFRGRLIGGAASEKPAREENLEYWLERFPEEPAPSAPAPRGPKARRS